MKYLLDPASVSRIIKKSDMQKTAKSLFKRLYPIDADMTVNTSEIDVTEIANSNPVHLENPMLGELMEHIRRTTTKGSQNNEDDFHSLAKEFSLFEITGTRSSHLMLLEQCLYNIPPTSVEAERAFSVAGLFNTKLRSSLSDSFALNLSYHGYVNTVLNTPI